MGLDHGRSAIGLVSWWWLLGARSECKTRREIQQHTLRVGLVSYCCGLTLISTCPSPNFQSFLHNQYHQGKKERSLPTSNLSLESLKKKKNEKKIPKQIFASSKLYPPRFLPQPLSSLNVLLSNKNHTKRT